MRGNKHTAQCIAAMCFRAAPVVHVPPNCLNAEMEYTCNWPLNKWILVMHRALLTLSALYKNLADCRDCLQRWLNGRKELLENKKSTTSGLVGYRRNENMR